MENQNSLQYRKITMHSKCKWKRREKQHHQRLRSVSCAAYSVFLSQIWYSRYQHWLTFIFIFIYDVSKYAIIRIVLSHTLLFVCFAWWYSSIHFHLSSSVVWTDKWQWKWNASTCIRTCMLIRVFSLILCVRHREIITQKFSLIELRLCEI